MNRNRQCGTGHRGMQKRCMGTNDRPQIQNLMGQRITYSRQESSMPENSPFKNIIGQVLETTSGLIREFLLEKDVSKILPQAKPKPLSYPLVSTDLCTGCGKCANACPHLAITINTTAVINESLCSGCRKCFDACPRGAITFIEAGV